MATDFTTDAQRDTIIKGALRKLGAIPSNTAASSDETTDADHALNLIIKQHDGDPRLKMFLNYTVRSVAVSTNDTEVDLASGVLFVEGCYYKKDSDSSVVPLISMDFKQYMEQIGAEQTADDPTHYYVSENGDRASQITMFFNTPIAGDGDIYYWTRDKIDLFDNSTDQADFPDSWIRYLEWALAHDLAWEYGKSVEEIDRLEKQADKAYIFLTEQQLMVTDYTKREQEPTDKDF